MGTSKAKLERHLTRVIVNARRQAQRAWERGDAAAVRRHEQTIELANRRWPK